MKMITKSEWRKAHDLHEGNGLKIAKHLQLEQKKKIFTNNPYLTTDDWKDKKANDLTRCIITFINMIGYQAERVSSMGRVIDNRKQFTDVVGRVRTVGGTQYIPGSSRRGTADISATIKGRSVKIEVKIGRDKQSDYQLDYEKSITAAGGIYYIARDFQSFYEWLLILISRFGGHSYE